MERKGENGQTLEDAFQKINEEIVKENIEKRKHRDRIKNFRANLRFSDGMPIFH